MVQKSVSFGLLDTVAFVLQLVEKKNRSQGPVTIKIMFVPPFYISGILYVDLFLCPCLFPSSPEESSDTVKVASYILIGVGSLTMAMGFFGCIGSIYEVRCLLGLVRSYTDFKLFFCLYLQSSA